MERSSDGTDIDTDIDESQEGEAENNTVQLRFPRNIRFPVDNTTSEGKNNTVSQMLSLLVNKKQADSSKRSTFRVGHTHNKQDQRLAVVNGGLVTATSAASQQPT